MYNEENIKRIIANSNLLDYHNAVVCRHYNWFFSQNPTVWFNSSFAINSKVQFSQQKQPVHLPAGSQLGVELQRASQQNRDGGCFIERKILPLRSVTETETTSYLTHTTGVTQQKYNNAMFNLHFFYFVDDCHPVN